MDIRISPCRKLQGRIEVPGDKSVSHRAVMLGALSEGITEISGFLMSADCLSTISCFEKMGVLKKWESVSIGMTLKKPLRSKGAHSMGSGHLQSFSIQETAVLRPALSPVFLRDSPLKVRWTVTAPSAGAP